MKSKTRSPLPSRDASAIAIRKILVPVDFSAAGKPALVYARFLAHLTGATVWLLHVIETIYSDVELMSVAPDTSRIREFANRELGRIQAEDFSDIKSNSTVREGLPFQEITAEALEQAADAIVMATHGYTGLKHIIIGSTTERVVRYAHCPVLVVRSASEKKVARTGRRP